MKLQVAHVRGTQQAAVSQEERVAPRKGLVVFDRLQHNWFGECLLWGCRMIQQARLGSCFVA